MKKSKLSKKRIKLKKAGLDTIESALGFIPGIGTALNIRNTAIRTRKTIKASKEYGNALADEIRKKFKR